MELGKDMDNSEVEEIMKKQKPEDCALLIYTVSEGDTPNCSVHIRGDTLNHTH